MAGVVYDRNENQNAIDILNSQSQYFSSIEKEKAVVEKMILKYAVIIGVSSLFLISLKAFVKMKKK